ncbi:hypothetical protein BBP40_012394 [Aspergillus hancockii]|nr:hypothetical protein BBP40_012394 [Aspergillus hancockii]
MSYHEVYHMSFPGINSDHVGIFVLTEIDGSGTLFHVVGSMQQGMTFSPRPEDKPENSVTCKDYKLIGKVAVDKYDKFREVCRSIPPPKKQLEFNYRLYPDEPLRTSKEWVDEAIQALWEKNVLEAVESSELEDTRG